MDAIAQYCHEIFESCFPEEVAVQVVPQGVTLLVILNRAETCQIDGDTARQVVLDHVRYATSAYRPSCYTTLIVSCRLWGELVPEWEIPYCLIETTPASPKVSLETSEVAAEFTAEEEEVFTFDDILSQSDDTAFGMVPGGSSPPRPSATTEELTVIQSYRNSLMVQFEAEAVELAEIPLEMPPESPQDSLEPQGPPIPPPESPAEVVVLPTAAIVDAPSDAGSEVVPLASYCFVRNQSLITAPLPPPAAGIARQVMYFTHLSEGEQCRLLPTLVDFFRDPKRTAIAELPEEQREWLAEIKNAEAGVLRSVAIWLSRYCADPEGTAVVLRDVLAAAEAEVTVIQEASQRAIAQVETTLLRSRNRTGTQGINVSLQRTFALPDEPTGLQRGEPFDPNSLGAFPGGLGWRLWAAWLSYVLLAIALIGTLVVLGEQPLWLVAPSVAVLFGALHLSTDAFMDRLLESGGAPRWISLGELGRSHPRCLMLLEEICHRYRLPLPRLGVIKLKTPYLLTYGIRQPRFVLAAELLTAFSDEELSLLLSQGLGHVYWGGLAVVSFGSLIPMVATVAQSRFGDLPAQLRQLSGVPYLGTLFLGLATLLDTVTWVLQRLADGVDLPLQWLLRERHYHSDRFAAVATGNPQRLWRTLAKLAHFAVTHPAETNTSAQRARDYLTTFARFNIVDLDGAIALGSSYAYGATNGTTGSLLSWELFSPRADLLEMQRQHPLLGRRLQRLCQIPPADGDLQQQIGAQQQPLSALRLAQGLFYEKLLTLGEPLWVLLALLLGYGTFTHGRYPLLGVPLVLGALVLGRVLRLTLLFPRLGPMSSLTISRLLGDPYASAVRGQPVQLQGILTQRGDRLLDYGSTLKLVDETGVIDLVFPEPLLTVGHPLGRATALVEKHKAVILQGWFYRTTIPTVRVARLTSEDTKPLTFRHRSRHVASIAILTLLAAVALWLILGTPAASPPPAVGMGTF
jgi:Zn-dependent protease with chaperone function